MTAAAVTAGGILLHEEITQGGGIEGWEAWTNWVGFHTPNFLTGNGEEGGFWGVIDYALALLVASIGGLFPDIDHKNSYISNKLHFSTAWFMKHRGPTHTIYMYLGMIGFYWYATSFGTVHFSGFDFSGRAEVNYLPLIGEFLFWLGIGSLLHIFGDMHTTSGVRIFGARMRAYRTLPSFLIFSTGGGKESIFMFLYTALFLYSVLGHFEGLGLFTGLFS